MQPHSATGTSPLQAVPMQERVLGRVVSDQAARQGERVFMSFEDRRISFRELDRLSNRLANGLAGLGVGAGAQVALMLDNKPEVVLLYLALAKLGAVAVAVNTAAKGELLAYYLTQSDSQLLIIDEALVERLLPVADRVPQLARVVTLADDAPSALPAALTLAQSDYLALLDAPDTPPGVQVRFCDLHALIYTSGTTGASKGNMTTHASALTIALQLAQAYGYRKDDVLYVCLPLFHGNAWLCSVLPALVAGAQIALSRRFSVSGFWDDIRRHGVTQFNALGAMAHFLWSQQPDPRDRDHRVRQVMVVPTPREIYHAFEERFGVRFTSLYALTDCGIVTVRGMDAPADKWASSGRACEGVELRIVDDDDFPQPPGIPGEIVVRSREPWMHAQGYYAMPEATAAANRNLWFHTGDRGVLDAEGYLSFVDRKKDAIRRRGENISSFEVEQIILKHPAVLDVAAYAVTSEHSEDEVMVSVVLRDGASLAEATLIAHCAENMAYFMVPRYVEFRAALPRTMTEKIEKYKLKAQAEQHLARLWDREQAGIVIQR